MSTGTYIMSNDSVTVVVRGKVYNFTSAHPNWFQLRTAIAEKKWKAVEKLVDLVASLKKFSHGAVEVKQGEIFYKGEPTNNVVSARILKMQQERAPFKPLVRFLDNLMQNPLQSAINELYLFLEHTDLPITSDGHFLAFKKVRSNYMDIYTGGISNRPGRVPKMERDRVDPDRDRTCSRGLHFCGESYLNSYGAAEGGNRIVIVKVNPKDVVAIPSDYSNAKGRACRYKVVGELGVDYTAADMKKAVAKFRR